MTQTINIDTAEEPELRRWLAKQPCPVCKGTKLNPDGEHAFHILRWDALGVAVPDCSCLDTNGKPTGLALPWASEMCPYSWHRGGQPQPSLVEDNCVAGRVPKADLGLEELHVALRALGQGIRIEYRALATGRIDCLVTGELRMGYIVTGVGDTDTEAALRAIAKAGMRCAS